MEHRLLGNCTPNLCRPDSLTKKINILRFSFSLFQPLAPQVCDAGKSMSYKKVH